MVLCRKKNKIWSKLRVAIILLICLPFASNADLTCTLRWYWHLTIWFIVSMEISARQINCSQHAIAVSPTVLQCFCTECCLVSVHLMAYDFLRTIDWISAITIQIGTSSSVFGFLVSFWLAVCERSRKKNDFFLLFFFLRLYNWIVCTTSCVQNMCGGLVCLDN